MAFFLAGGAAVRGEDTRASAAVVREELGKHLEADSGRVERLRALEEQAKQDRTDAREILTDLAELRGDLRAVCAATHSSCSSPAR